MTTLNTSRIKPADFTDILDKLDDVPHGRNSAAQAAYIADDDLDEEAAISPETRQPNDWLAHLLGNVTTLWSGAARAWISPSSAPYAEDGVGTPAEEASDNDKAYQDALHSLDRPSLSEQDEIAAELGLKPGLSEVELRRLRRAFALENHPDRLIPEFRDEATRRMTIANMLIDDVLHKQKAKH